MTQNVIITGGASGIGLRMAERFLARGDQVAVSDADGEAIKALASTHPAILARRASVTDEAEMQTFFEEALAQWGGQLDVVCANAGTGGPAGQLETLEYEAWKSCVEVNLLGAFVTCKCAAPILRKAERGLILITSSSSGQHGVPNRSPYVAAKWGLIGLTKTLAMELGEAGVRVNALAPGAVEGPRMERVLAMEAEATGRDVETIRAVYAEGTSLRTWVTADDVANMALFLASPEAAKITGQVLTIDGHTERMV